MIQSIKDGYEILKREIKNANLKTEIVKDI